MAKILFLTRSFYPNIGGVEKHIAEISERLITRGHEVTILTEEFKKTKSRNYHSFASSARVKGSSNKIRIATIQARKERRLKKYLIWFELLKHWKTFLMADVVHCHDVFYWYLPFRFLFPFKKIYTTFHGYEGNNIPTKKAILMHEIAEVLSNGNICVGDFLKKWYGTKPTFVTYGAVEKRLLGFSKVNKKNNKIIFVGRLEKETGISKYLEALKILKHKEDKRLDLSMDVYGDGALRNELIKYSNKHKLKINFKGHIMNIENVLNNYEYIFCSRYLSILEGLAVKRPIFAEYDNLIKKDYLLMAPFSKYISISSNPAEIASNLEKYMKGKKNFNLEGGYEWVKDKTWDYMTDLYLKLWKFS